MEASNRSIFYGTVDVKLLSTMAWQKCSTAGEMKHPFQPMTGTVTFRKFLEKSEQRGSHFLSFFFPDRMKMCAMSLALIDGSCVTLD